MGFYACLAMGKVCFRTTFLKTFDITVFLIHGVIMLNSYSNAGNWVFSFEGPHRSYLSNAWKDVNTALSPQAAMLTVSFVGIAVLISLATELSFSSIPNFAPFIAAIMVFDFVCRLAPRTRISTSVSVALYGFVYLILTCVAAAFVTYANRGCASHCRIVYSHL